jgi:hypothetical protein
LHRSGSPGTQCHRFEWNRIAQIFGWHVFAWTGAMTLSLPYSECSLLTAVGNEGVERDSERATDCQGCQCGIKDIKKPLHYGSSKRRMIFESCRRLMLIDELIDPNSQANNEGSAPSALACPKNG